MDGFFDWSATNNISDEMVRCFENSTGMEFNIKEQAHQPNLCYIESEEVRDEFRTTFTRSDILNYIYAIQHSSCLTMNQEALPGVDYVLPYPKSNITFWKLARLGKELKLAVTKDSRLAKELIKAIAMVH